MYVFALRMTHPYLCEHPKQARHCKPHVCVCVGGGGGPSSQRLMLGIFFDYYISYFLMQSILLNLGFTYSARLAGWVESPWICLSFPQHCTAVPYTHHNAWVFIWILRIWTRVFTLEQQSPYQTEPVPQLLTNCFPVQTLPFPGASDSSTHGHSESLDCS